MLVSLPNPLIDGTTAFGSEVKENDDSIVSVVNGGLDNDNMRANADAAGKGLTTDKLADASVTTAKIADANVTAVKLADDGTPGNGCNLSELYTGAGFDNTSGYPPTNVIAARKQQGGKTIWAYINLAATTRFLLDDSIDWRNRLIFAQGIFINGTGSPKAFLPGGASETTMRGTMWLVLTDVTGLNNTAGFYTSTGSTDGEAQPFCTLQADLIGGGANPSTAIRISAAQTTGGGITAGNLTIKVTSAGFETGVTSIDLCLMISCSPVIE